MESQPQTLFMNNHENSSTCIRFTLENGRWQFQRVYKIDIFLRVVIKQGDLTALINPFSFKFS